MARAVARSVAVLAVPVALYLVLAAILGEWIVDDSGISYAYARNAADGYGLVSQPGRAPVEGFSNFLWVMVLIPFFKVGLFHPVFTPKLVAAVLVTAALFVVQRLFRDETGSDLAGVIAAALVAIAAPIVIWTTSGLENALALLLATLLLSSLTRRKERWELRSGVWVALLGMTHPEHILLFGAVLVMCVASAWPAAPSETEASAAEASRQSPRAPARQRLGAVLRSTTWATIGLIAVFGPFLAFRLAVFGLPFPHPYYAKRFTPSLLSRVGELVGEPRVTVDKWIDLCHGIAGPAGPALVYGSLAAAILLALWWQRRRLPLALASCQMVTMGAYLWLERDWMGEYRFATLPTAFSLLTLVAVGFSIVGLARRPGLRVGAVVAYVALLALLTYHHGSRIVRFALNPTVEFQKVAGIARKFDAYVDLLGLEQASLYIADAGATLYGSRLRIYDAAGLTEPDVVRTLRKGTIYWLDVHPEFYDYVFEDIKPTFISTYGFFTRVTAFEKDPRFHRDYVAINRTDDPFVLATTGWKLHSGDYVRRESLHNGDLERLRQWRDPLVRGGDVRGWTSPLLERIAPLPEGAAESTAEGLRLLVVNPLRAARCFARALERQPGDRVATAQLARALDGTFRVDVARPYWQASEHLAAAAGDRREEAVARRRLGGS